MSPLELKHVPADDPEAVRLVQSSEQPLEVVRRHRQVGIQLHHDSRERFDASSPRSTPGRSAHPLTPGRSYTGRLDRAVRRARVGDQARRIVGRAVSTMTQVSGRTVCAATEETSRLGVLIGLVVRRGDDGIPAAHGNVAARAKARGRNVSIDV